MEFWDIYDENKQLTGRMMKRNDWCLKDGEYHLTVLGVIARPDGTFLITKRDYDKSMGTCWVGMFPVAECRLESLLKKRYKEK